MVLHLGVVDYVIIGIMLAISASVGIFFRFTGGRQKTTQEFLMAGRSMSICPVAFSLMATYMSAISVLGVPSETYMYGSQFIFWSIGSVIGGVIAAYVYVPVFFETGVATAYEYLELRFGKITRTVASVLFIFQMILYMAVVLYAPSLALNAVTGLSTWTSVVTLAAVCTFYCSLGGLKAVLWTDVFQAILMYVAIIAIVIKGCIDVGGIGESFDIASKGGRLIFFNISTDIKERYTFWNALMSGLVFGCNTFGTNQAQVQRMLSVKTLKKAQRALLISLPMIVAFNIFCVWDGVAIYSYFHDCDPLQRSDTTNITSPDQLLPYAIVILFHYIPGLAGLCVSGVFSASLSTISSAVNSLTAVTMEDFIRPYCFCTRLTETWATFMAKVIAVVYGGVCLLVTFLVANFRGVIEAANVMFGLVGGPILGVFSLGILTATANEEGTLIGLLVGFVFNAWMGFGSYSSKINIPHLVLSTEGCPLLENSTNSLLQSATDYHNVSQMLPVVAEISEENERLFPLYKISFMWFPLFGFLTVLVVGYIASFIIGCIKKIPDPKKPEVFSPVMRRWILKQPPSKIEVKKEVTDVPTINGEMKEQIIMDDIQMIFECKTQPIL